MKRILIAIVATAIGPISMFIGLFAALIGALSLFRAVMNGRPGL